MLKLYTLPKLSVEGVSKTIELLLENEEDIQEKWRHSRWDSKDWTYDLQSNDSCDVAMWEGLRRWINRKTPNEKMSMKLNCFLYRTLYRYLYIHRDELCTKKEVYTIKDGNIVYDFIKHNGNVYSVAYLPYHRIKDVYVGNFLVNDEDFFILSHTKYESNNIVGVVQFENIAGCLTHVMKGDIKSLRRAIATGIVDLSSIK